MESLPFPLIWYHCANNDVCVIILGKNLTKKKNEKLCQSWQYLEEAVQNESDYAIFKELKYDRLQWQLYEYIYKYIYSCKRETERERDGCKYNEKNTGRKANSSVILNRSYPF